LDHDAARRIFLKTGGTGAVGAVLVGSGTAATPPARSGEIFNVRSFGAAGDGHALDTAAINRAIAAASANHGGIVFLAAGSYLCYSIHLKSDVTLHLGPGATIVAADAPTSGTSGYDPPEANQWDQYQDFGHSHWRNSLIWGEDVSNVTVMGPGRIWGKGLSRGTEDTALAAGIGNKSISLKNSRNVILRDLSILHGGHFAILATGVDNLTIDNLIIDTNRDGIDVDCCRNVRISSCSINSPWDDAICLKSSFGLGYARPTDNVTVTNCYVTGGYEEGTLLDGSYQRIPADKEIPRNGRIKFGTESNGGFRNITISNCTLEDCKGIALETVDGGVLEDVTIANIAMRDIADLPFFLRLGSRLRGPKGVPVGSFRRVLISDVVVSNAASQQASIVTGIPGHKIEHVRFANIFVQHRGGGPKEAASMTPPENENAYPEADSFGPMPAHGFFLRHTAGVSMRDIELEAVQEDFRPAFVLEDVDGADFMHIKLSKPGATSFVLRNVKNFEIMQSRPIPDTYLEAAADRSI
jgi:polygalacturonase